MLLISFSTLILILFSTFSTLIFILPDWWHVQGRHGEDNSKVQHEVSPHQQWPVRTHGVQPHVLHSHWPHWAYQRVNLHCTLKCISLPISLWRFWSEWVGGINLSGSPILHNVEFQNFVDSLNLFKSLSI